MYERWFFQIQFQLKGIEAHFSINLRERYLQTLRQIFRKLIVYHTNVDKHHTLTLTVKAINETLGTNGDTPSTLVFGEVSHVFTRSETRTTRSNIEARAQI